MFARDALCRLARQFQSHRVKQLKFEDIYQMFQERYSEQNVRLSLAKMVSLLSWHVNRFELLLTRLNPQCAEGILREDEVANSSIYSCSS